MKRTRAGVRKNVNNPCLKSCVVYVFSEKIAILASRALIPKEICVVDSFLVSRTVLTSRSIVLVSQESPALRGFLVSAPPRSGRRSSQLADS